MGLHGRDPGRLHRGGGILIWTKEEEKGDPGGGSHMNRSTETRTCEVFLGTLGKSFLFAGM